MRAWNATGFLGRVRVGKTMKVVLGTVAAMTVLGAGAALALLYSGIYDIAANEPHLAPVRWLFTTGQQNAVREHAEGIQAPPLRDAALIRRGFVLYQENCLVCHGAPGVPRAQIGRGLNPNPPPLFMAASEWSDAELYWIIKHGLKMAGMPAFDAGHSETDLWALTAFTRRLPELSLEEYRRMVAAAEGRVPTAAVEWVDRDEPGFALLRARGRPERGEELMSRYGCGSCHLIPGVSWARGKTGPPLDRWAERHYIAGELLNTPRNLVAWIVDPQAIEPGTAMPGLGVSPEEALHVAAYLYTLGTPPWELREARRARDR
jgi:mono/diheme cytochrome c family protein